MTPEFDQKVEKYFAGYIYYHFTMSLLDRMMGQTCLDYLNLLHLQGVTLEDAEKSEFGMVSATEGTAGVEERLGFSKCCKLGTCKFACI